MQDVLGKLGSQSTDVTGAQSGALANLSAAASGLPNFGPSSSDAINNLFNSSTAPQVGMLGNAYTDLTNRIGMTANGSDLNPMSIPGMADLHGNLGGVAGGQYLDPMKTAGIADLQNNLGRTASGAELDPYLTPGFSDALRTMTQDITNQTKGVYAGSGRDPAGAGSFAGSLGRGLMQGEAPVIASQFNQNKQNQMNAAGTLQNAITGQSNILRQNQMGAAQALAGALSGQYNTSKAAQLGAAGNLFGAGGSTASGITGQNQVPLQNAISGIGMLPAAIQAYLAGPSAQLGAANAAYAQPWTNLQSLLSPAASIAGLGGQSAGTGTSQTIQPQNTLSNVIGGTMAAAALFSDERVKDDIQPVGKLYDGQDVYSYRYKGSNTPQIGLLAQSVAEHVPDAVGNVAGILTVHYGKATERAAEIGRAR